MKASVTWRLLQDKFLRLMYQRRKIFAIKELRKTGLSNFWDFLILVDKGRYNI